MTRNSTNNDEKSTLSDDLPQSGQRRHDDTICAESRDEQAMVQKEGTSNSDDKRIITETDCYDALGYSWPAWRKWMLLSSIFAVQVSMNFNTSVFPSAIEPISEHFHVSLQAARVGQCVFLVCYAFGCELWAPWSEEFGRWPILQ